jgi:hypothetical protein
MPAMQPHGLHVLQHTAGRVRGGGHASALQQGRSLVVAVLGLVVITSVVGEALQRV